MEGASTTATSTGNWNNSGTWSDGVPSCGDTVFINSGVTVTVTDHVNLDETSACSTAMYIEVSGILKFNNGKKIYTPCGSAVYIQSGGSLQKGTGGGNSNLIDVCQSTIWNAGDGSLSGPQWVGSGLPITLKVFTAELKFDFVHLSWTTLSEINNDFFTIEKSNDLEHIQEIISVNGGGNTNEEINYEAIDAERIHETTYYRLKQTDFNGAFSHSNWVAVSPAENSKSDLEVLPSYVKDHFLIRFNDGRSGLNRIVLVDTKGSVLHSEEINIASQFYVWSSRQMPISHKGLAILFVISDNKKEEFKLFFE